MKVLNFGSLNLDLVYQMPHFVRAGETLSSTEFTRNVGGKGLNQSVALAQAGAGVYHAGLIGADGDILRDFLNSRGVDTRLVKTIGTPTGHAIIQVEPAGNNAIFLYGGANQCVTEDFIRDALAMFDAGDLLVLQNEINMIDRIIELAHEKGMRVVLNPSPIAENLKQLQLDKIDWFILNEIEGAAISGAECTDGMAERLADCFPNAKIVLTLGGEGSLCVHDGQIDRQAAYKVRAVDTTAAGDTFAGFFFAAVSRGESIPYALKLASKAAAISVTRAGAAGSIPSLDEVLKALE